MSGRFLCVVAFLALTVSACASTEQSSPQTTTSPSASTSSSATPTAASSTTAAPPASGPVAEILGAVQVRPEDFHDMSFGGDKPEDMTPSSGMVGFMTPSSNIACVWSPDNPNVETRLICSVRERTSPLPARPADCQNAWATSHVQLNADGVLQDGVCTGGVLVPSVANVLPYGSALVADQFGCLSAENGITCANMTNGKGFFLSRESLNAV
jgi:hypothetical protein